MTPTRNSSRPELFSTNPFKNPPPPPTTATSGWKHYNTPPRQNLYHDDTMTPHGGLQHSLPVNQAMPPTQIRPMAHTMPARNPPISPAMPHGLPAYQPTSWEHRLESRLANLEARFEEERRRNQHAEWALRSDITRLADHIDSIGATMRAHMRELDEKLGHSLEERARETRNLKRAMDDKLRPLWDRMDEMEERSIERPTRLEMGNEMQAQTKLLEKFLKRWEDDKPARAVEEVDNTPPAQPTVEEEIAESKHEMQRDEAEDEVVLTIGDDEIRVPIPVELPAPTLSALEQPIAVSDWPYPSRSTGRRAPAVKSMGKRNLEHLKGSAVAGLGRLVPSARMEATALPRDSPCPSSSSSSSDTNRASSVLTIQPDGSEVPVFFFRKLPDTVAELWAEFAHGLHGQAPVRSLNARYGVRWRSDQYARTWFSRRKRFWWLIKDLQEKDGLSEVDALAEVERMKGNATVAKLIDNLAQKARVSKSERPVDTVVREATRKRRRTNIVEDEEDEGDSDGGTDDERVAKRTTPMQLRKRTVGPVEDTSDWDYDENE